MTNVSLLFSAPSSVEGVDASAAHSIARFVRLFEPGGWIEKWTGPPTGLISS